MGNGLRKAIIHERWNDVREKLQNDSNCGRVRYKNYKFREEKPHDNDDDGYEFVSALHILATKRAPKDIVEQFVLIAPNSVHRLSSESREVPLHFAAKNRRCKTSMIRILATASPEAAVTRSKRQRLTPLHMACEKKRCVKVLKAFVDSIGTDALLFEDSEGRTPWDVLQENTRFYHYFYRRAARRVLTIPPIQEVNERMITDVEETNNADEKSENDSVAKNKKLLDYNNNTATILNDDNNKQDVSNKQGLCVLCWDGEANHAMVPCGHLCLCNDCGKYNASRLGSRKCPVCNSVSQCCIRIYDSGIRSKS